MTIGCDTLDLSIHGPPALASALLPPQNMDIVHYGWQVGGWHSTLKLSSFDLIYHDTFYQLKFVSFSF